MTPRSAAERGPASERHNVRYVYQCPGCWSYSLQKAGRMWECECGERLTRIDLRAPEPSPFAGVATAAVPLDASNVREAIAAALEATLGPPADGISTAYRRAIVDYAIARLASADEEGRDA